VHVVGLAFALAAVSLSSSISLAAGLYTNRLLGVSLKVCMYVWYVCLVFIFNASVSMLVFCVSQGRGDDDCLRAGKRLEESHYYFPCTINVCMYVLYIYVCMHPEIYI
jgi:hypothetical protein